MHTAPVRGTTHYDDTKCSTSSLILRLPCTGSRDAQVCQLLRYLDTYNNVLWDLGFQLKEDKEDELGDLRLVASPAFLDRKLRITPFMPDVQSAPAAVALLEWLLIVHRCLILVELNYVIAKGGSLPWALQRSLGVRKVHISCWGLHEGNEPACPERIFTVIACLGPIEELVFVTEPVSNVRFLTFEIDRHDSSLTTLDIRRLRMTHSSARQLIALLVRNNSLSNLGVGDCVFKLRALSDYLGKHESKLRSLSVVSERRCYTTELLKVVAAISTMTSLQELSGTAVFCDREGSPVFAEVVARNKHLRSMSVKWPLKWVDWARSAFSRLHGVEPPT